MVKSRNSQSRLKGSWLLDWLTAQLAARHANESHSSAYPGNAKATNANATSARAAKPPAHHARPKTAPQAPQPVQPKTQRNTQRIYTAELPIDSLNESSERLPRSTQSPAPPPKSPQKPSQQSPQQPPQPPDDRPVAQKPWRWSLIWLGSLGVLGGMGTAALIWLVSLPPQIDCRQPERLSLDMEKLYCAQEAAQTGEIAKLIAGIDLLKQWQPEHPLYREAQRLINEWSGQVLIHATRRVERGELKSAEAAISHIPASVPAYQDAQKAVGRWRKYSKTASDIYAKAQDSLKQKDWSAVSQRIVQLAEFERDYWELEKGANALGQQLGAEKQAWQTLTKAQKLAAGGRPEGMRDAIPLAQQVPDKTYAATTAKANLKQWSQKLLSVGAEKWQKGDRAGAVALLKLDDRVVNTPEIADLYRFSHAYKLASTAVNDNWLPAVGHLVNLMEAIAAMEQVKPDSSFYAQAQSLRKDWQAQLQDLIQLKYASASASLGRSSFLDLAIKQAQQIDAERPRRVQAQTLIAHWQGEAERIEDQPIVDRAIRIAKPGTIESLKAAIQQASQIDLGRSLRGRAQTLIATWRSQIQTIEDRPQLDRAQQLAQQGRLGEAIAAASKIEAGRALYDDAQAAIGEWRYQQIVDAQIAQDQPILDRANSLAENGNLSAAIDVASQISSGRALYSRAQSAINRWQDQLNPPPPVAPPSDSYAPLEPLLTDPFATEPAPPVAPGVEGASSFPMPSLPPSPINRAPQPSSSPYSSPNPPSPIAPNAPAPPAAYEPLPNAPEPVNPLEIVPAPGTYEPLPPVDPLPPEPLPPSP